MATPVITPTIPPRNPAQPNFNTQAFSYVLPSIRTPSLDAARVATAPSYPGLYRVHIRVIGPVAQHAVFSIDNPTELNIPGIDPIPLGDVFSIPATGGGAGDTIMLQQGQSLYAKGSDTGVCISLTLSRVDRASS